MCRTWRVIGRRRCHAQAASTSSGHVSGCAWHPHANKSSGLSTARISLPCHKQGNAHERQVTMTAPESSQGTQGHQMTSSPDMDAIDLRWLHQKDSKTKHPSHPGDRDLSLDRDAERLLPPRVNEAQQSLPHPSFREAGCCHCCSFACYFGQPKTLFWK